MLIMIQYDENEIISDDIGHILTKIVEVHQIDVALNPPSTTISAPVMKLLAVGEASKSVAPMSSSGLPKRDAGVCLRISKTLASSSIVVLCSAGKKPGIKVLTRMSNSAHSRARFFVRLCTAALLAD